MMENQDFISKILKSAEMSATPEIKISDRLMNLETHVFTVSVFALGLAKKIQLGGELYFAHDTFSDLCFFNEELKEEFQRLSKEISKIEDTEISSSKLEEQFSILNNEIMIVADLLVRLNG